MRILVTGASGYLGRHLVPALHASGHTVIAAGHADADLRRPEDARRLVETTRPEVVIHLAWEATPGVYWTSPDNAEWADGTAALAEAARAHGVHRFVGVGSCAEYDWTGSGDLDEYRTPELPATPYGAAKLAASRAVLALENETFLPAWCRVFLLFGGHEYPARLVPSIALALRRGDAAPCTHGRQVRDFLHVEDVAGALMAVSASDVTGVVNIASGDPHPVGDVIAGLAQRVGRPDLIRLGEIPMREPNRLVTRAARLRQDVGWRPQWSFDEALDRTADFWSRQ